MRNLCWLLRNNYPKKHATSNLNITAYDRGLYLQVEIVFGRGVIKEKIWFVNIITDFVTKLRLLRNNFSEITQLIIEINFVNRIIS